MFSRKSQSAGAQNPDWASKAAGLIEGLVDGVHEKAVVPLTTVARILVFGLLVTFAGLGALILLAAGLIRVLDVYVGNVPGVSNAVWPADLAAGGIFVIIGMVLWSLRSKRTNNHEG